MDRDAVIEELRKLIGSYLESQDREFIDLIYRYEGSDLVLRVLVDKPEGGISLDECARHNRNISQMLDEKDIPQERYILEVSSPGLDRPLRTKSDLARSISKEVKFFLNEPVEGKLEWDGVIERLDDQAVYINTGKGPLVIPFSKINKGRRIIK
ncbi:MAG: ribosome maturation factor RimP [Candidatus Omnitrophica bacterium]|nr:ribosome maturation factor RimP [Candidatus Omnitrophota bacterium]